MKVMLTFVPSHVTPLYAMWLKVLSVFDDVLLVQKLSYSSVNLITILTLTSSV